MSRPVLLSDVGKVLIDFDFSIAARRLAERCLHPAETVLSLFDDIKVPYEDGRMDDPSFVAEALALSGFGGTAQDFEAIWCEIFAENELMSATLAPLAGKLPMFLLSNTNGLHKDYFLRTFPIFQNFQGGVYSHTARCAKPGEEIFQKAIADLDLDPAKTFYIDDLLPNIETASRMGFRTFHYSFAKHPQLQVELDTWLAEQGIG